MMEVGDRHGGYDRDEFIAEAYDLEYSTAGVFAKRPGRMKDVDFFVEYAKQAKGETLELGCGTGRVLVPTAAAGCRITGLDLAELMLRKCAANLAAQPEETRKRARLVRRDMTAFDLKTRFALVTIPFRPFQHLVTVTEQKACLSCIHQHLQAKGRLVFDVFNPRLDRLFDPKYQIEVEDMPETALPDGRHLRRTNRTAAFHRDQQYNDIEIIYYISYPDGRSERLVQSFPMRYYFRYEVEHLLELASFRVTDLFGDFDKSAFQSDSVEMIFVAEKKGD
jgi:SAM-dependent methyltransferase